jgi:hypothetical protein
MEQDDGQGSGAFLGNVKGGPVAGDEFGPIDFFGGDHLDEIDPLAGHHGPDRRTGQGQ